MTGANAAPLVSQTLVVTTEADLDAAIRTADSLTTAGAYTIELAGDITESSTRSHSTCIPASA